MKFEHIIQVNDLLNPLVEPLSREEIWEGLVESVEAPTRFLPGIDTCRILWREGDKLCRELHFGHAVVHDTVRLTPGHRIAIDFDPSPEVPALKRTMTIEEPIEGEYIVRFRYERSPQGHEPLAPAFASVLEAAWLQADIDLIAQIRRDRGG
ncbi:MAG TPA: AtaL-like protein [Usitatibacteraceae bacterium]|nr:AtaL-like protein [Usitatibacteraceae bacterium]